MDELLAKRRGEIELQNLPDLPNAKADRGATLLTLQDFGRVVRHNNFLAAVSMLERQFKNVIEYFTIHKPETELKKFVLKGRSGTNLQQYFNYKLKAIPGQNLISDIGQRFIGEAVAGFL